MALMVEIEAFYGARVSEILGLRAEDITFTGLDVTAPLGPQLARVAALSADKYEARSARLRFDRKLNVDRTHAEIKNRRGYRTLPLPQWLASALAAQLGQWPPVDGWLFTNPRGPGGYRGHWDRAPHPRPWCQKNYRVWFAKAAEKTGVTLIKGQSTHALRHHCVSVLRDRGLSAQAIGYWIGDAATSVDTYYGRPMPDAMDRIAAELSGARDTGPRLRAVD
jgi:integrase